MLTYIIRRLLLMFPTLLGITALVFFPMALSPGGVGGPLLNKEGNLRGKEAQRMREYYDKRYGLNDPAIVQYTRWLNLISPFGFIYTTTTNVQDVPFTVDDDTQFFRDGDHSGAHVKLSNIQIGQEVVVHFDPAGGKRHHEVHIADPDNPTTIPPGAKDQLDGILKSTGGPAFTITTSADVTTSRRLGFKAPSLGESLTSHRPVVDLVLETLPITILLNLITIPIVYVIGILSGIFAAHYRGQWFDVSSGVVFLGLWSVPTIWAGVLLIGCLANSQYLNIFPTSGLHDLFAFDMTYLPTHTHGHWQPGYLLDMAWHLVLPVACMSYGGFAFLSKLTRSSILENLSSDYVRTARAKGVGGKTILFRHVFRNSTLALITIAAGIIPSLLGGSIVIESIFSLPGMGRLSVQAVQFRDRELILGMTLVFGMIGLLSGLLRDIWYAAADPRISYE